MEIRAFANLLWRWAWLIVLVTVLSGGLAYIVSAQLPAKYEAKATVTVARRSAADSEFTAISERPTATYIELLRKRPVLDAVINKLQLNMSVETLEKHLRVSLLRNTSLIVLTVTDSDPQRAATIANEIVSLTSERGRELLGNDVTISRYSLFVVDPARAALKPVSPNIPLNVAVVSVVGALLAVAGIMLREYLDDRVRSAEEVDHLIKSRTLAAVPQQASTLVQGKLASVSDGFSPAVESYRMLRAHVEHVAASRPLHTLMITSATDQEGKSTTLANLAVVLAQAGRRVVLVDTDLRNPTLHTIFRQPNVRGVTTALQNEAENLSSHLAPTGVANLSLLPSGPLPPNPAELIGSPRMARLIERLKAEADFVLFDSPALLDVVDPISLAKLCDATMLVVRSGALRAGALVGAHDRLAQFGIEPLGVVLNGIKASRGMQFDVFAKRSQPVAARRGAAAQASTAPGEQGNSGLAPAMSDYRTDSRMIAGRPADPARSDGSASL